MAAGKTYDTALIGAGVFGSWTAHQLNERGQKVILLDAYGAANARASSGGESRIIRMGYGADEIYTRLAMQALPLWKEFFRRVGRTQLFECTGVLWLARESAAYERNCVESFEKLGIPYERLTRAQLRERYPQFNLDPGAGRASLEPVTWGFLEPGSGVLMARRAVQAVVDEARQRGVDYEIARVSAPSGRGRLASLTTGSGNRIRAGLFVFACGPWLPKVFPRLLGDRIFPTRQEVYFFGSPGGDLRFRPPQMPAWINLGDEVYGMPDLENRGFKVAIDRHGPAYDPDTGRRTVTPQGVAAVRQYVGQRLAGAENAAIVETRVCQYENTSNGDFLVDRHPGFDNVWLVGGGSGHGFKHGPALGDYVVGRILDGRPLEPRYTLATKNNVQQRAVF